jgi:mRNA-degrading endonuclease toxin of MazEF toxin-antitoxin module
VFVEAAELEDGLKDSVIDCGHVRSIDKASRIDSSRGVVAHLSAVTMKKVDDALRASLGMKAKETSAWPDAVSLNSDLSSDEGLA